MTNAEFASDTVNFLITALDDIALLLAESSTGVDYELIGTVARAYADLADITGEIAEYTDSE